MKIRVLLFGPEAAALQRTEVAVAISDGAGCRELRARLEAEFPPLRTSLAAARFAVNGEFAASDHPLREEDEVALIGMVSGG